MGMVSTLTQHTGQLIAHRTPATWHWQGRPVRLVDGTTVPMPDTAANQATYPQPRSQKLGLGFPLCRLVGILCLGSGAVLNAAIGAYRGKGGDEQTLLRQILDTLPSDRRQVFQDHLKGLIHGEEGSEEKCGDFSEAENSCQSDDAGSDHSGD